MSGKRDKEPQKATSSEVLYSELYDDEPIVLLTERIAVSAFREWISSAGVGERRAQNLVNKPELVLNKRERELVLRTADTAIAATVVTDVTAGEKRGD